MTLTIQKLIVIFHPSTPFESFDLVTPAGTVPASLDIGPHPEPLQRQIQGFQSGQRVPAPVLGLDNDIPLRCASVPSRGLVIAGVQSHNWTAKSLL